MLMEGDLTLGGEYKFNIDNVSQSVTLALAGVAQWIESWLVNQNTTVLIPGQSTCLGCRPGPQLGACKRQLIDVSIAYCCFSSHINVSLHLFLFPLPLSQNKKIKSFKKHCLILNHQDLDELSLLPCDSKIFYTFLTYTEIGDVV